MTRFQVSWLAVGSVLLSPIQVSAEHCSDVPHWHDNYDYRCEHYASSQYCTPQGLPGTGWESHWGALSDWKVEGGMDATQACCACGGGSQSERGPKSGKASPRKKGKDYMSGRDWKAKVGSVDDKYDPGWKYAGRVPALPPREAKYELVSKAGTMICHMTPDDLEAANSNTPFFVHIAKTGGRALLRYTQQVLGTKYCEDWIYMHVNPTFNIPRETEKGIFDSDCSNKLVNYVSSLRAFTIVRDPLERLVSEVGHSRVLPNVKAAFGTLEEHVAAMIGKRRYHNFQTGVLAGKRVCNGDTVVTREELENVKNMIREEKLLVGIMEDLEHSLEYIFEEIGRKLPEVIQIPFSDVQKTPKATTAPELVQQLRDGSSSKFAAMYAKWRQDNALDYELYEFAKAHIAARSAQTEL